MPTILGISLQWCHNGRDGVSNHRRFDCLLNRLFRCRSKETPKLRVTGLCEGNSAVTGEFPSQRASNAENVFSWWRHHVAKLSVGHIGTEKCILVTMIFLFAVWFHANLNVVHATLLCCIPKKGGLVEVEMLVQEDGCNPNGMSMKSHGGHFCIPCPLCGEHKNDFFPLTPKNYAHGSRFRCCINCIVARYRLISSISARVTSPDLGQSYGRPSVRDATLNNMDKWITMNIYIYIYIVHILWGILHNPMSQATQAITR